MSRDRDTGGKLIFGAIVFIILIPVMLIAERCNGQDSLLIKTVGYCGNIKLSEIDAEYGEAAFTMKASMLAGTALKQFVFDYGQAYKKDKEALVNNDKGQLIGFNSVAQALNFFYFNGWEFIAKLDNNSTYILLFRKRKLQ